MASKKFLVDIDLQLNQLLQLILENVNLSSSTPTLKGGRIVYNTADSKPYYCNGSTWVEFGGTTITSGMNFKGAYDAANNSPDLENSPSGVKIGDTYVVSTNGTFFTITSEDLQIGDLLIAKQDNPVLLAHWVRVNKNIPDIVQATETVQGIIEIATQAEVNAGIDDQRAITPLKLKNYFTNNPLLLKRVCPVGVIGENVFLITHNLGGDYNISGLIVNVWENGSGEIVECLVRIESPNEIIIEFNQPCILNNQYTAVIIG